jgi:carboxyl-terminal processing protease
VSTRGKVKEWDNVYKALQNPVDTTIRIAVITNRGSASASEIIAGAMQDLDRGLIIGSRTFGKGLVQTTRDLSYNSKLKVTTAKYYVPSGRCIQALDYSHRNEDGSVGNVPDSLISQFSTKNARKVFDGGGVVPDIKVDQDDLNNLAVELVTRFVVFDFATHFAAKNPAIPQPEDFEITDMIYDEFVNFVKNSSFRYNSETEELYAELVKTAKSEKYFEMASDEFMALESKLKPDLDKDLRLFREIISDLIKDEITTRYYFQKGAIRATIHDDATIMKAREILGSPGIYAEYFKPGTVISAN